MKYSIFLGLMVMGGTGILFARGELSASELLASADRAYARFDYETTLTYCQQAFAADSHNYQVAWKLSRAYGEIGEELKNKDERKAHFKKSEHFARKAVEINPDSAKGHVFLSVALGRVALEAGAKERIRLSKEIKEEVDRAIEIDPNDDIPWHVLGRWHRKIATLNWLERNFANIFFGGVPKEASLEEALRCFQRAIELHPEHINHHLQLALTYEKLKEKELAIQTYEKVLALPAVDPDDNAHQQLARERLKKLNGRESG